VTCDDSVTRLSVAKPDTSKRILRAACTPGMYGRVTAAMVYDRLPINDAFRRLDDDTVLGLMDQKGPAKTFVFVLRRQRPTAVSSAVISSST